jgi:hypothetical protein
MPLCTAEARAKKRSRVRAVAAASLGTVGRLRRAKSHFEQRRACLSLGVWGQLSSMARAFSGLALAPVQFALRPLRRALPASGAPHSGACGLVASACRAGGYGGGGACDSVCRVLFLAGGRSRATRFVRRQLTSLQPCYPFSSFLDVCFGSCIRCPPGACYDMVLYARNIVRCLRRVLRAQPSHRQGVDPHAVSGCSQACSACRSREWEGERTGEGASGVVSARARARARAR